MAVVTCSSCAARIKVQDEMLGRTAKCPKCAVSIVLTESTAVQTAVPTAAAKPPKKPARPPAEDAPQRPSRRPGRDANSNASEERPDPALWKIPLVGLYMVKWTALTQVITIVLTPIVVIVTGILAEMLRAHWIASFGGLFVMVAQVVLPLSVLVHMAGQILCCFSPAPGPRRLAVISLLGIIAIPVLIIAAIVTALVTSSARRVMDDPFNFGSAAASLIVLGIVLMILICYVGTFVLWMLYGVSVARTFRDPSLANGFFTFMCCVFGFGFVLFIVLLMPARPYEKGVILGGVSLLGSIALLTWYFFLISALIVSISRRRIALTTDVREDNPFAQEDESVKRTSGKRAPADDATSDSPASGNAGGNAGGGDNPFDFG